MKNASSSLIGEQKMLEVPRGRGTGSPIAFNATPIYDAVNQIDQVRRATAITSPDLMATFNMAMHTTSKLISLIELEKSYAEASLREAKAVAILDRADAMLAARNMKSTADLREAVVNLDPDVVGAKERLDNLTAMLTFFTNTYYELREALYSTKKICDIYLKLPNDPNTGGERQ
jgi:hypothetical protein